ncbi:MAG TPA: hypothetical protein VI564_08265 [Candidatus Nanoarchaeia archaeon]|nr:hypothetical protein [Candidatus Nanoarchaeia archaeon]
MADEENAIRTSADDLLDLVKKKGKVSVDDASKELKVSASTVQALVDFLVEEKVFGIEYKFTTPYIFINDELAKHSSNKDRAFTKDLITKEQFYKKAKSRSVPYENIEGLWRKYLQQNLETLRKEFLKKAVEKKIAESNVEELWNKYLSYL